MKSLIFLLLLCLPISSLAQQKESYDYWQFNKSLVARGVQSLLMCNGVLTSDRSIEQVFDQELAYVLGQQGTEEDDYVVDTEKRAVAVGLEDDLPAMRSAYRDGLGCIVLPPDQTFDDIDDLPVLNTPPLASDPSTTPWPDGDLIEEADLPAEIDAAALQAASEWAFDRATHGTTQQVTLSLLVVYKGQIILERYAPGVDVSTKTRTWSTAKSIAATLIGMLVDQGKMALDEPLDIDWLPSAASPDTDPRSGITLRHVLNMSSGLEPGR